MSSDTPSVLVPDSAQSADMKAVRNYKKETVGFLVLICILAAFALGLLVQVNELQSRVGLLENECDGLTTQNSNLQAEVTRLQEVAEEGKFEFYYASLAKQRYGVDDLQEYLDRWEWTEGSYVQGSFDCSEMSAYIEWRLENEGYHTRIVTGDSPWGSGRHAWLLVETSSGKYMPVEATTYSMVTWYNSYFDNYFEYDRSFETIQEALNYSQDEFDWWNS